MDTTDTLTATIPPMEWEAWPIARGLNHQYFATASTAQWIATRYGTGEVTDLLELHRSNIKGYELGSDRMEAARVFRATPDGSWHVAGLVASRIQALEPLRNGMTDADYTKMVDQFITKMLADEPRTFEVYRRDGK